MNNNVRKLVFVLALLLVASMVAFALTTEEYERIFQAGYDAGWAYAARNPAPRNPPIARGVYELGTEEQRAYNSGFTRGFFDQRAGN